MYSFSAKTKIKSAEVNSNFTEAAPIGKICDFGGSSAPTGWLLCDGSAVSRTTYASLFAIIGTTYGAGDGSTTFNLPNCKGKTSVGFNAAEAEFDALGETGGEKTHLLTAAESGLPAHTHTAYVTANGTTGVGAYAFTGSTPGQPGILANSAANASSAHNNLQPYITLNKIIKF